MGSGTSNCPGISGEGGGTGEKEEGKEKEGEEAGEKENEETCSKKNSKIKRGKKVGKKLKHINDWKTCGNKCSENDECKGWTWKKGSNTCRLYNKKTLKTKEKYNKYTSGARGCPAEGEGT